MTLSDGATVGGWRRTLGQDLPFGGNDAGVEAGQVQAAVETGMLNLHAAVHHDVEPGGFRFLRHVLVPGAQLQPQCLGARGDGFIQNARQVVVLAAVRRARGSCA